VADDDELGQDGEVRILHPEGRLDVALAPAFRDQMRHLLDGGSTKVILDLGGLSFIDSSGLGAIIVGLKMARSRGGEVRIVHPPPQFKTLLQLTSLSRVLPIYACLEDALADFD
jgi:anti-sigma B factor antagonist